MAWFTIALTALKNGGKYLLEHPKLIRVGLEVIAGIWIIVCCMTHCGQYRNGTNVGKSDTVVVSDTVLMYDTTWKELLGDTISYYTELLKEPEWTAPSADYSASDDCSDSLAVAIGVLDQCDELLTECDEKYRSDYALRGYRDSISNDTIHLVYDFHVRGRLEKAPKFNYQIRIPERTITNTVTVTNTIGPRRALYVGGSAGPLFDTEGPNWRAMNVSLRFGYTDKKNNRYGLRASYNTLNLWSAEIEYTRSFSFGK